MHNVIGTCYNEKVMTYYFSPSLSPFFPSVIDRILYIDLVCDVIITSRRRRDLFLFGTNPPILMLQDETILCIGWKCGRFNSLSPRLVINVTLHNSCIREQLKIIIYVLSIAVWWRMPQFYAKFTKMRIEVANCCLSILQSETRLDV